MRRVELISIGWVSIGPVTLYGVLKGLVKKGLYLERFGIGFYTFHRTDKCETDIVYQLDYFSGRKADRSEYLTFYEEAGRDLTLEYSGWSYFLKSLSEGSGTKIYTDSEGRIGIDHRVMITFLIVGWPSMF